MSIEYSVKKNVVSRWFLLVGIIFFLGLGTGCGDSKKEAPPSLPKVMAAKVQLAMVPLTATFGGNLVAKETVEVRARVSGYVATKLFEEGAWVKAGTVIYTLDDRDLKAILESAVALAAKALAASKNSDLTRDRMVALAKTGSISLQQRDTAVAKAAENLASYQSALSDERQAAVNLSYATIYAPTDGYMARSNVEVGSIVEVGAPTPLTTVYKTDPIRAEFSITDRDFFTSREFDASPDSNQSPVAFSLAMGDGRRQYTHPGVLEMADPIIDPKTNTMGVRVQFPNPDYILRPGMYVNITATAGSKERLMVPEVAVLDQANTKVVYVVDEKQILVPTIITVGQKWEDQLIVESGLTAGQVVVVEGLVTARAGMKVEVVFKEPIDTEPVSAESEATSQPRKAPDEAAAPEAVAPEAAAPEAVSSEAAAPEAVSSEAAAPPQEVTGETVAIENPEYKDGAGQIVVRETPPPSDKQ